MDPDLDVPVKVCRSRQMDQCNVWDCTRVVQPYCSLHSNSPVSRDTHNTKAIVIFGETDLIKQDRVSEKVLNSKAGLRHCGVPTVPDYFLEDHPLQCREVLDLQRLEAARKRENLITWVFFTPSSYGPLNTVWRMEETIEVFGNNRTSLSLIQQPQFGNFTLHKYTSALVRDPLFFLHYARHDGVNLQGIEELSFTNFFEYTREMNPYGTNFMQVEPEDWKWVQVAQPMPMQQALVQDLQVLEHEDEVSKLSHALSVSSLRDAEDAEFTKPVKNEMVKGDDVDGEKAAKEIEAVDTKIDRELDGSSCSS